MFIKHITNEKTTNTLLCIFFNTRRYNQVYWRQIWKKCVMKITNTYYIKYTMYSLSSCSIGSYPVWYCILVFLFIYIYTSLFWTKCSVFITVTGDGIHSIPLHRMCIINMSLSDESIINHLLIETMKVERKEFEGQKRSNENDIILHRQRLAKEHVSWNT